MGELNNKNIRLFCVLGQKPEHVQLARDSWNIPFEILEDEQLTLAKQLSEAKHGNVTIHPTAWHPLITSRPAVGHDPKHPEYDYPQGMSQPAVILFAKRTEENALEKSMYSLKSLYFWAGKNATPRPKPSACARHVVKVVGAYEEGKPIPGLRHESGYSMGHVFCVGKRSLCQIQ